MVKPDEIEMILECLKNDGRLPDSIMGSPTKRQYSILQKWDRRGHWDFGVSLRTGWMTSEGKDYFTKMIADEVRKYMSKTLENVLVGIEQEGSARRAAKAILSLEGLILEDNDDITYEGKVVAKFGKASFKDDRLEYTIQPMKAIEFILVDIKLDDIKAAT